MNSIKTYKLPNIKIRKKYWIINAIISIPLRGSRPFRNNLLWVFGSWSGDSYEDNSRYLYEYVEKHDKRIKPVWISKNAEIVTTLVEQGHVAYLSTTREARSIMRKAGAFFYTNGLDGISDLCLAYGAHIFNLNHASVALKKIYWQVNKDSKIKKALKKIKYWIFDLYKFDYLFTTSEKAVEVWREAFDSNSWKYRITGMPRNDIFFKEYYGNCFGRYILYMPTYRPYKNDITSKLLHKILSNDELCRALKKNNCKFIVKLHNADFVGEKPITSNETVIVISNGTVDTQELLRGADVLISDYSSCVLDYALLNRPILIYAPDLSLYNDTNGVIAEWIDIVNDIGMTTEEDVIEQLLDILCKKNNIDLFNTYRIRELFNDISIGREFSKNVYESVLDILNIES